MSTSENPQRLMLNKFIDALREQGFLDENFNTTGLENPSDNQNYMATFCSDAEEKLEKVDKSLNADNVDFGDVETTMQQMKENAARIGGKRVASACGELEECSKTNNIQRCREAYKQIVWEYYILRDCFHHVLQALRTIYYVDE